MSFTVRISRSAWLQEFHDISCQFYIITEDYVNTEAESFTSK